MNKLRGEGGLSEFFCFFSYAAVKIYMLNTHACLGAIQERNK